MKREVLRRDGGRCTLLGEQGRCPERGFLEFHHVVPFAEGGEATVENTRLMCRTHNDLQARRCFDALGAPELFAAPATASGGS